MDVGVAAGGGVCSGDAGEAQHVIERPVLKHEAKYVLDSVGQKDLLFWVRSVLGKVRHVLALRCNRYCSATKMGINP